MTSFLLVFFTISLVAAASCYFASASILIAIIVFVLFFLGLWLLGGPMLDKFHIANRKRHECFRFVNSFVVTLSVSKSIDLAYSTAMEGLGKEIEKLGRSIADLSGIEKVEYLQSYFQTSIYQMFLSTLNIYQNEGGDIIGLSAELLSELTRIEESENDVIALNRKNLIQFALLWVISLAVVVFLRVGLQNFYDLLASSTIFLISIIAYYALLLASLVIYISVYTGSPVSLPFKKKEKPASRKGVSNENA